ncbi:MAG: GIY-YIG nuclease family protein, partial [Dissulfurispiraceae bacterium]
MARSNNDKVWCVYALRCKGNYIYTGVTNDIDNRMKAHSEGRG